VKNEMREYFESLYSEYVAERGLPEMSDECVGAVERREFARNAFHGCTGMGGYAAARMWDRLTKAERQREVLAEALRKAHAEIINVQANYHRIALQKIPAGNAMKRLFPIWRIMSTALRECGLLRAQDDPSMIPAAWLPGAEEEEG
jgi:hypothetical protein